MSKLSRKIHKMGREVKRDIKKGCRKLAHGFEELDGKVYRSYCKTVDKLYDMTHPDSKKYKRINDRVNELVRSTPWITNDEIQEILIKEGYLKKIHPMGWFVI